MAGFDLTLVALVVTTLLAILGLVLSWPSFVTWWKRRKLDDFKRTRDWQRRNPSKVNDEAAGYYSATGLVKVLQIDGTDSASVRILCDAGWIPPTPLKLSDVRIRWDQVEEHSFEQLEPVNPAHSPSEHPIDHCSFGRTIARSRFLLPWAPSGRRYQRYSEAVLDLGLVEPAAFADRTPIYRLTEVHPIGGAGVALSFARGWYYDHYDTEEVLAFETARSIVGASGSPPLNPKRTGVVPRYRGAFEPPLDLRNRCASCAITTLTLFQKADEWYFLMHDRSMTGVAEGEGQLHVIPGMTFAPAIGVSTDRILIERDFDLTRCIIREYGEEVAGEPEFDSTEDFLDYPPYSKLSVAIRGARIRPYFLGIEVNPLNLRPEILVACVFDGGTFFEIFPSPVKEDAEGRLVWQTTQTVGCRFTMENVTHYLRREEVFVSGKAALALAWQSRANLTSPNHVNAA